MIYGIAKKRFALC